MKKILALLLLSATLLLAGCSAISAGRITEKVIEPANTWIQMVCSGYNDKGFCSVWVPVYHYDDQDWRFDISDGEQEGFVYVTEGTFNYYNVGDWFEVPKEN